MIKVITSNSMPSIIAEITSYISSSVETDDERTAYINELSEVEHDFLKLVNSGVFHDACGKVLGVRGCFDNYEVIVTTEY